MHYRLTQLLILGCYIIHSIESIFIFNLTNTNKIVCYSCKTNNCESILNDDDDNVVVCNRNTQLCWAGFVDQQPYRTCASRFCTPSGISLDSDIHIETCCHSNLCNSIPLYSSKRYTKTSTPLPATSRASTVATTTKQTTTTTKRKPATPRFYIVDEIVNSEGKSSTYGENGEDSSISKSQLNASDPASFGIIWARQTFETDFSNRVASISKLLILVMPVLLFLLF